MSAQEVAGKLTKAQAWQLRQATVTTDGRWHVKSNSVTKAGPWPEGMTEYYSWALDRLTPLGLEVRRILQEQGHD